MSKALNARVAAATIDPPRNDPNWANYRPVGEILRMDRHGTSIIEISRLHQGILRFTTDEAVELVKSLEAVGITAKGDNESDPNNTSL